jgi:hypothetical protein
MLIVFACRSQGAYPEIAADAILSNNDDDDDGDRPTGRDNPKDKDEPFMGPPPDADDVEVLGKTSAKTIIPIPIMTGTHGTTVPLAVDRAKATPAPGAQTCTHH